MNSLDTKGVWLKFGRAEKHIIDLELAISEFCNSHPYALGFKPHRIPEIHHTTIFIKELVPIPPDISLLLGDAVHNLRSALDHLAWQLVDAHGIESPTSDTYFPIGDPSKQYTSAFANGKVKGMSVEAKKLIRLMQPCNCGDFTLWNLHCLDIADKHRLVITAQLASESWGIDTQSGYTLWFDQTAFTVMLGDEISNLPTDTFQRCKHEDYKLALDIAFGQSEIVAGEPIMGTIHHMANTVRDLIKQFEVIDNS